MDELLPCPICQPYGWEITHLRDAVFWCSHCHTRFDMSELVNPDNTLTGSELERKAMKRWNELNRRTLPAAGKQTTCSKCNGSGIEQHIFHGVWPNGDECVEPVKCADCDGFGHTSAPDANAAQDVRNQALELLQKLVDGLEKTHWASAQTTSHFQDELEMAIQFLKDTQ